MQAPLQWSWLFARLGTLGWGTLLAGVLLSLFEWSGLGTSWVEKTLSTRLAALGGELELGTADFRWLEPGLVLEDLSLATEEEVLSAEHLHVRFGWQAGLTLVPTQVHLRGARVVLDPALADGVRALLDIPDKVTLTKLKDAGLPTLPDVLIEDLTVLVETSTGDQIEVLHVDLALDATSDGSQVVGRVQTPRQRTEGVPPSIRLSGGVNEDGVLNLHGQALDLEITSADVPDVPELETIRGWEPQGTLDLEAHIVVDLLQESAPKAEFTGRLEGASLLPPGAKRAVEDLELLYTVSFDPKGDDWLWDTTAWEGVASASGGFADETFEAGALLGDSARNDSHFEAWVELEAVDIGAPLDDLFQEAQWFDDLHLAASPSGAFSARISTRLPRLPEGDEGVLQRPEMLIHVDVEPGTQLTYHGWPTQDPEREPVGFPVPASVQEGEILYAYTRLLPRRGLMRIHLDLEHESGQAEVSYLKWSAPVDTPPFASGTETHLEINVTRLDVNEELERVMAGLDPVLDKEAIWKQYAPRGGSLGVDLYLANLPGSPTSGIRLDLDVRGVDCTVETFPVPISSANGELKVVSQPNGQLGTSWNLSGSSESAEFSVSGRERSQRDGENDRERVLSTIALRAEHIDVNGPVFDVLEEGTRDTLEALALQGEVKAHLMTNASGARRRGLELEPVPGLSASPPDFPDRVNNLRGTLRLAWNDADPLEENDTMGRAPGIEGTGPDNEQILFTGEGARDGWSGSVFATGISASLWDTDEALTLAGYEENELSLRGEVDLKAQFARSSPSEEEEVTELSGETPGEDWTTEIEVVLRSNTLTDGSTPLLDKLEGRFAMVNGHITAPLIKGHLGETVVTLEDVDIMSGVEALSLSTEIRASGIPLDTEHLFALLEEELLTSLVEELGLRGTVDVESGTLQVTAPREGSRSVSFKGYLTIADMALEAGLPVVVQSARVNVKELIVEDGELRGRGSVEKLYGSCFESALGPVEAKGSYIGGVLSIEDFSGSFERGTINPLDRDSKTLSPVRGRPAFRIVLRPPFPYQASVAVNEVDATRWLEGISSDVGTSSGTLTVKADLNGNLGSLVETRGRGSIHLERSRLWSIPLFRELLREFGLDHTVMFDEVQFDFEIDDKVVTMEDLVLRSPLLKLVGRGTLDKEGRLNHRLEVHYSIVDKITPFRRLFYLVQNVFVSVKIRGDLSRPLVLLSNGLFSLFQGEPNVTPSLPLPGLSPLPRRF